MPESPIEPVVEATKRASVHFAKAAYEVMSGLGILVSGVVRVVRDEDETDDVPPTQHIPVE